MYIGKLYLIWFDLKSIYCTVVNLLLCGRFLKIISYLKAFKKNHGILIIIGMLSIMFYRLEKQ